MSTRHLGTSIIEKQSPDSTSLRCPICGCGNASCKVEAPDRFHLRKEVYRVLECHECSCAWLENPPAISEMPYHYGTDYHKSVRRSGETDLIDRWRKPREVVLATGSGDALLDVGCSSGAFLRSLRGERWRLYGVEISPAEAQVAFETSGAEVHVGTVLDAPFARHSFDVITCFHILEHVHDINQVVQRFHEWLRPNGILYFQAPNIAALEARIFRSYWYGLELPRHLYHFSPHSLRRLFTGNDFAEVFLRTLPDCYVEKSFRYIVDDLSAILGVQRVPLAASNADVTLLWRVVRKAIRLGILWPFRQTSAALGSGAGIEGAFRKKD